MARRHLVVDGSNIATEGRAAPSLAQLDEAVRELQTERGYDLVTVVVDATFGHRIDATERDTYEDAVMNGELITPPAGAIGRGDAFVLQIADRAGADVFSNDSFQEFHGTYPWLFEEGRLIGGKPVPNVGWVFVLRAPVRGAISRRSVRDARNSTKPAKKPSLAAVPAVPSSAQRKTVAIAAATEPEERVNKEAARGRRRRAGSSAPALNEPLAYATFVIEHPVGTTVEGTVERFSSHGAYIRVGDARGYVPLRELGDPPPRSAREVLNLGETGSFVVNRFDPDRRGIDLVPTSEVVTVTTEGGTSAVTAVATATGSTNHVTDAEEAHVSPVAKKATAKKATAKRAPAKKTAATKTTAARKTTTTRAPAKKSAAKKATAKKTTTAKRAPAKKTAAKKTTAKKTTAARKTTAKKTTTARKTVAKR
jgi:Histone H1-like nucleoprotein HC2/S1 RNA binding domain/Zc3h12a-like Ribonuclease NYN domain